MSNIVTSGFLDSSIRPSTAASWGVAALSTSVNWRLEVGAVAGGGTGGTGGGTGGAGGGVTGGTTWDTDTNTWDAETRQWQGVG